MSALDGECETLLSGGGGGGGGGKESGSLSQKAQKVKSTHDICSS